MAKIFIHGTSAENARHILGNPSVGKFSTFAGELDKDFTTIWNCSDDNMIYVRDVDAREFDGDALRYAIESGQIAAAKQHSLSKDIAVFIFKIEDEELAEKLFEEDHSCQNMDGCYQINRDDLQNAIVAGKINCTVRFYHDCFKPYLAPFYLTFAASSDYFEFDDPDFEEAVKAIAKADCYVDAVWEWYEDEYDEVEFVPCVKSADELVLVAAAA